MDAKSAVDVTGKSLQEDGAVHERICAQSKRRPIRHDLQPVSPRESPDLGEVFWLGGVLGRVLLTRHSLPAPQRVTRDPVNEMRKSVVGPLDVHSNEDRLSRRNRTEELVTLGQESLAAFSRSQSHDLRTSQGYDGRTAIAPSSLPLTFALLAALQLIL